jgi:hypothetical protein
LPLEVVLPVGLVLLLVAFLLYRRWRRARAQRAMMQMAAVPVSAEIVVSADLNQTSNVVQNYDGKGAAVYGGPPGGFSVPQPGPGYGNGVKTAFPVENQAFLPGPPQGFIQNAQVIEINVQNFNAVVPLVSLDQFMSYYGERICRICGTEFNPRYDHRILPCRHVFIITFSADEQVKL